MKQLFFAAIVVLVLAAVIWGCERAAPPNATEAENFLGRTAHSGDLDSPSDSTTLAGFVVWFDSSRYNGTNTTFYYTVTGPAQTQMHFRLGFPITNCAAYPISWFPGNGTTSNNDQNGINPGLEWHPSTSTSLYQFSYTFAGRIPTGIVRTSVKTSGGVGVGQISGPGVPTYEISGAVYQDASRDGFLDPNETGIAGVRVYLLQSGTRVDSTQSGAQGAYSFPAVLCGTYTVQVDTASLTGTQTTYFDPTSPISIQVTVGPDSPGINFGFETDAAKLKLDLRSGTLPTSGFKADFWKKQVSAAKRNGNATYSRDSVLAFINRMNGSGYALPDPFVFPSGTNDEKLDYALNILSKPIRSDADKLARELLALEFNQAARKGIDLTTQLVLIGWAESLLGPLSTSPVGTREVGLDSPMGDVEDAIEVIILINKSTGGGAVGE